MSKVEKKANEKNIPKTFILDKQIKSVTGSLYYISETDSEILPFVGEETDVVSAAEILRQTANKVETPVEERNFDEFFEKLTKLQSWFGDEEKASAAKYAQLKDLLESNLRNLKVFRIGEIQLEIYVVGLPEENILAGIKTKAVET